MGSFRGTVWLEECDDHYVERIAHILGASSAAAKAVAERDRRRSAGEAVAVFLDKRGLWVVGPGSTSTQGDR